MADTADSSDGVFGLLGLLGYLPRLADIGELGVVVRMASLQGGRFAIAKEVHPGVLAHRFQ